MRKLSASDFLHRANSKHNYKYKYHSEYYSGKSIISIECPIHGIFNQSAVGHLAGTGCHRCGIEKAHSGKKKNLANFIEKANIVHKNKFSYKSTIYTVAHEKVIITCPIHGDFEQSAYSHLAGKGCKKCRASIGEMKIREWLAGNSIKFVEQKRFPDCRREKKLSFDFYLEEHKLCIEFDGEQHFKTIHWYDKTPELGRKRLSLSLQRDAIKEIWCKEKGIRLERILFNENVNNRLIEIFNPQKTRHGA